MIADADDEIARLQREEVELERALAADAITNKEDFLARVDLSSYEGRARANELMKRLGILVTASKVDDTITYVVYKKELRIATMTDAGVDAPINTKAFSGSVQMAKYRQGETDELYVSPGFNRKLKTPEELRTPPVPTPVIDGPDWASYDGPFPDNDYDDEDTPTGG
jgi:hypothetical protein